MNCEWICWTEELGPVGEERGEGPVEEAVEQSE